MSLDQQCSTCNGRGTTERQLMMINSEGQSVSTTQVSLCEACNGEGFIEGGNR